MTFRAILALAAALALTGCSRPASDASAPPASAPPLPPPAPVESIAHAATPAPPVLFVGLDGADWQLLDDYMAHGIMPNLAGLVRGGRSGVLETDPPPLSPLVWTTMMTGRSPLDHGILDFVQFNPQTGAKEPITSTSRQVPAIWNMATAGGKKTAVLGLWATFPAEPIDGVIVSDRLSSFLFSDAPASPGVVYPAERAGWARQTLQRAEQGVDFPTIKSYLPWLTEGDYRAHSDASDPYAHPISALRRILVETRVYDELGREAFTRDHPDLTVVYFEGTDSIGHVFAPYAPPKQPAIPQADFDRYSGVPARYFHAIDDQLGAYRTLVEQAGGVLMIASDHGFFWKDGRPGSLSSNANATAAKWHRPSGMYVLWGAGVTAGPHNGRGSVTQICATLLALIGLPPGEGLMGSPLPGTPARGAAPPADYRATYQPPPPAPVSASAAGEADSLAKLKSLGYIADSGPAGQAGETRTPGAYNNEGVILRNAGKTDEAIAAFEQALSADPSLASASWNLSDLLFSRPAELDRSDELLVRAYANGLPEGTQILVGRAIGYQRARQTARSLKLINGGLDARPNDVELWLFRGRYRVDAGDCKGASSDFQRAEALAPRNAAAFAAEGLAQLCVGDREAARKALAQSLALDPNQPKVRDYLNRAGKRP